MRHLYLVTLHKWYILDNVSPLKILEVIFFKNVSLNPTCYPCVEDCIFSRICLWPKWIHNLEYRKFRDVGVSQNVMIPSETINIEEVKGSTALSHNVMIPSETINIEEVNNICSTRC
ncbi:hypothetical protein RchiOBHm_Chr1g0378601 [Rosa chinensis]|uniref:Uncharacterized protein n=1 Tax=Rosa chinensis TaxID=74649 RepID=A0A2P6SNH9_ROSCH|nr:hypothetical protein RchiOBHm_Chr1g0378601 [Rosa chinensis]